MFRIRVLSILSLPFNSSYLKIFSAKIYSQLIELFFLNELYKKILNNRNTLLNNYFYMGNKITRFENILSIYR